MKIKYGIPEPCHKCGEREKLYAIHGFGAKVVCPCGEEGRFVGGSEYQSEELWAVTAWNNRQRSLAKK